MIVHRDAQVVRIESADSFFRSVQQNVESIEEFSRPHPLSTEAAVASLKRYISDNRYRIQLMDLVDGEVARIADRVSGEAFAVEGTAPPDSDALTARVRGYEAASSTLLAMASVGGFWAEEEQYPVWQRALTCLYPSRLRSGNVLWLDLQKYPATLLLYALGLGAIEAGQLEFLTNLFDITVGRRDNDDVPAVVALPPSCMFEHGGNPMQMLEGMDRHYLPLNDWLHSTLRETMRRIVLDDEKYTWNFNKFEMLVALAFAYRDKQSMGRYWAPPGTYAHHHRNRIRIHNEIAKSLEEEGDESPFVKAEIFGKTDSDCRTNLSNLNDFVSSLRWGL